MQGQTAADMLVEVVAAYNSPEVEMQWLEQDPALPSLLQDLTDSSQQMGADVASTLRMSFRDRGNSQLSGMNPSATADW